MRYLLIVKSTPEGEAGARLSEEILTKMMTYNEAMAQAGVLLAAEKLQPSSQGVRARFTGGKPLVTDGPFAEAKELIAGFALWQVNSKEEAVEWLKRAPFEAGELELRLLSETDDFGPDLTPELQEQGQRIRALMAANVET